MNYGKTAYDKICDLERYVNSLTARQASQRENTVVFYCEQQAIAAASTPIEFEIELAEDSDILLDLCCAAVGSTSQLTVVTEVNNITLQTKKYASTNFCSFRTLLPFVAVKGINRVAVQLTSQSAITLNNLTAIFAGKSLLDKAISHVCGACNPQTGVWTFGEGRNNVFSVVDQTLSSTLRIKIFDSTIDKVAMCRIDKNYALVLSGGSMFSTECNTEAKTVRMANSVSDFCTVERGGQFLLFAVCRNRLYKRELTSAMTKAVLVPQNLNSSDKIYRVNAAKIDSNKYALCVETTNKIHIYINDGGVFTLVQSLVAIGMSSCFCEGNVVYVLTTVNTISRLYKTDLSSGLVDISQVSGSFDSMFQYAANKALASFDNKLQLTTLP